MCVKAANIFNKVMCRADVATSYRKTPTCYEIFLRSSDSERLARPLAVLVKFAEV